VVSTEEVELLENKDHALGMLATRLEALQQEGEVLGERSEHFPIRSVLQLHLHSDGLQGHSVVRVQITVQVDDESVFPERFIGQQIGQHGVDELKNLKA